MLVITGAAGLIGSGLVRHLNDCGHGPDLILVDRLDHPVKEANVCGKHYAQLLPIDKLHPFLQGRASEIRAIIHLGACSDTLEQDEEFLRENNTLYTQKLAEYCLKHNIRFIYASSAATYGDGSQGFSDDHDLLTALKPLNLYGKSKHAFDLWALQEGVLDKLVGLKYFNVFGPNEGHKGAMASMVFKMVPTIQKEGVIRLFKSNDPQTFPDGGQCRDFIYVKDVARMTAGFLENKRGGIFNIGRGAPITWNELAMAVFQALNLPPRIEYIPIPDALSKQYQNYTCALMDKFGPSTILSIQESTRDYIQNHILPGATW